MAPKDGGKGPANSRPVFGGKVLPRSVIQGPALIRQATAPSQRTRKAFSVNPRGFNVGQQGSRISPLLPDKATVPLQGSPSVQVRATRTYVVANFNAGTLRHKGAQVINDFGFRFHFCFVYG
jgi:hypothetical protein